MKTIILMLVLLFTSTLFAKTVYVIDRISLGVTELPESGLDAITRIQNGTKLEVLEEQGSFIKVKLPDGTEGWVRSYFVNEIMPASIKIKAVEKQNKQLKEKLVSLENKLKSNDQEEISPDELFSINQEKMALQGQLDQANAKKNRNLFIAFVLSLFTLIIGFILGYGILAKRVKEKFHGMKVW